MPLQVGPVSAAGSKLYIVDNAALPANYNSADGTYPIADYEALTYVEVGEITEIPEFGTKRAINTILTLGNSLARKSKGSQDSGTVAIPMLRVPSDAGQTIIQEAADSNNSYTFKVTLSDDFTPTTGHPTTFYFVGKVDGYPVNIGGVDGFVQSTVSIAIDSKVSVSVAV